MNLSLPSGRAEVSARIRARRRHTGWLAAVLLLGCATSAHAGRAKLLDAQWTSAPALPPASSVSEDRHTLTTQIATPPAELVAHAVLTFDISRGNDGMLSFLTDHSWMQCEAPDGLIVGESATVAVVCRAPADALARLTKPTRVYIKVDPPGGGQHRKLYWELLPPDA